ncbi:DEAD/DEAH box helicase family protein [Tissierella praeacuta]|mgnify:FL=1|jgi:superfamily II DNA or RNA helicase|uniref:DEAD/DEAH box helicase family protein n=1 Tax=Tissierella praeacuta TaxID=43131 RepID=UPI002FDB287D
MSLQDIEIKNEYRSLIDNVAKDFYIPLLKEAVSYKRAVGFFSSSALIQISKGIAGLTQNGGKIQLIASPYLSDDDVEAMRKGYELRESIIENALLRELRDETNSFDKERLNLLANLIADGILDIKIALTEKNGEIGMYHEKMGIISDSQGNKVAFSGSMNESATAMMINYEAIDVFCSWNDDIDRVLSKENAFESIWNNVEPNIKTIYFPKINEAIIKKYKNDDSNYNIDEEELYISKVCEEMPRYVGANIPNHIKLHDYQIAAIDKWEESNYRGIFDMATGTGKTYTGLGAVARLSNALFHKLSVFIVCPYQHLVEQWVEDIEAFGMHPIIGYSASPQKKWKKLLEDAILDQKLRVSNREFFCFVSTNATFASEYVQNQIERMKGSMLLVVDEAHNFGAEYLSKTLSEKFKYRLALSATINRHNDEEGTEKLFNYFGDKCIEYTLERAIEEKKLTRYKYYPIVTSLNELELEKYNNFSYEIGKCVLKGKNGKVKLSERGKILALARARLVAGAEDKIIKLEEYIKPYIGDKHILVYCGATTMLAENQEKSSTDDEDIRQIDLVTDLLGNKLNMKVSQFTSKEDASERMVLKNEFDSGDNLQALIAIKCLDEGVNIPKIKTAFILASTTNPKEYIQRRGRVLRLAKNKDYAIIYDFIALPRPLNTVTSITETEMKRDLTLVRNELNRAQEFAYLSMNMAEAENIIDEIKEAYCIEENYITYQEDLGYE